MYISSLPFLVRRADLFSEKDVHAQLLSSTPTRVVFAMFHTMRSRKLGPIAADGHASVGGTEKRSAAGR